MKGVRLGAEDVVRLLERSSTFFSPDFVLQREQARLSFSFNFLYLHLLYTPCQTIEFPDDELVEPLEGLDIADDGIELPPPPAPEADVEVAPAKPNLLVSSCLGCECGSHGTCTVLCVPFQSRPTLSCMPIGSSFPFDLSSGCRLLSFLSYECESVQL